MAIVYVGIDLAKNVFAVHGVDEHGKPALVRPKVARDKPHERVAALPPCRAAALPPCRPAALRDRHGSLLGRPPLGAAIRGSGPRGAADGAEVRRALPVER